MATTLNSPLIQPMCPKCLSEFVKRSRRAGLVDHLISLFSFYPFRCQLCKSRFHLLQKDAIYQRIDKDRREYERFPVNLPATFSTGTFHGEGVIADISIAGCLLCTEARLVKGELLQIALQLPSQADPVTVAVAILRGYATGQARLEFIRLEDSEKVRLQEFIRELISGGSFG